MTRMKTRVFGAVAMTGVAEGDVAETIGGATVPALLFWVLFGLLVLVLWGTGRLIAKSIAEGESCLQVAKDSQQISIDMMKLAEQALGQAATLRVGRLTAEGGSQKEIEKGEVTAKISEEDSGRVGRS